MPYCKTHTFSYLGKNRTLFTRQAKLDAKWYYRVRSKAGEVLICLGTHVVAGAEKNARDVILAHLQGADKFSALRDETKIRKTTTVKVPGSLADLEKAYRSSAAGRIDPHTIHHNILSLRIVVRTALGGRPEPGAVMLQQLTGDLVHVFKRNVLAGAAAKVELDRRRAQRTANSYLRQARSLFTPELVNTYRRDFNLEMPAALASFQAEPGFADVSKQQGEYNLPSDHLIKRTFDALTLLKHTNRPAFIAIWLALGFGLRKEEIAGVRARNFLMLRGTPAVELEEVWVHFQGKSITKNGSVRPVIPVTNGAWEHLEPMLRTIPPGDFVIGDNKTFRCENVYREISAWMRDLGWQTQKAVHEFRAYAGCQVAMRDGIYQASKWLRHSSVTVTEKNYSRYVVQRVTSAPIALPDVSTGIFQPHVVNQS